MTTTDAGAPQLDGAPLFLLDELPDTPELLVDGSEGRHAVEVLRLEPGQRVRVGDGQGTVAEGQVVSAGSPALFRLARGESDVLTPHLETGANVGSVPVHGHAVEARV